MIAPALPTRVRADSAFEATHLAHAHAAKSISDMLGCTYGGTEEEAPCKMASGRLKKECIIVAPSEVKFAVAAKQEHQKGPWASDTPVQEVCLSPGHISVRTSLRQSTSEVAGVQAQSVQQTPTYGRRRLYRIILNGCAALKNTYMQALSTAGSISCSQQEGPDLALCGQWCLIGLAFDFSMQCGMLPLHPGSGHSRLHNQRHNASHAREMKIPVLLRLTTTCFIPLCAGMALTGPKDMRQAKTLWCGT